MRFRILGLIAMVCMAMSLHAADKKTPDKAKEPPAATDSASTAAPDFNNTWAVNGPYTLSGLKGKVVVLYFYESG